MSVFGFGEVVPDGIINGISEPVPTRPAQGNATVDALNYLQRSPVGGIELCRQLQPKFAHCWPLAGLAIDRCGIVPAVPIYRHL